MIENMLPTWLRKRKVDNEVHVEIPDADWKCPRCGVGHGENGLIHEEFVPPTPAPPWNNGCDFIVCFNCDWQGTALELYEHAARKKNPDYDPAD